MLLPPGKSAYLALFVAADLQVVPGATWTANNTGTHIQAHGGGITVADGRYYWVGEDKTNGSAFQNINCYSSTDLVQWTFVGALLSRQGSGDLGPERVVERPKVVWNQNSGQYVLFLHIDSSNYGEAKVGIATSSEVCGQYEYRGSFRPLGYQSRDMGVFVDEDGSGYLLTEDRENGLRIDALSADFLNVTFPTYVFSESIESPALVKHQGVYFIFGSHLTGWDTNDNVYATATSLSGLWSSWTNFADKGSNTYNSQTSFILPLRANTNGGGTEALYMGDRWVPDNLMRSTYIWLPLSLDADSRTARLTNTDAFPLSRDASSGQWTSELWPNKQTYQAETAWDGLRGNPRTVNCDNCDGGTAIGYIGGPDNGTVAIPNVRLPGGMQTLQIKYTNGDLDQRFADVRVGNEQEGPGGRVAFLPTGSGNNPGTSVLHLQVGDSETDGVLVGKEDSGIGNMWGPDLDSIVVAQ
ncbi:glycosyl hydrolase family 43 protein [Lineolata rhizophorae]|uniref:Glycosyl hydrolase family 43 protein n=1 Tax=Lineolata rhizophorae TaxID=578093 RepID=A0A6A6NZ82_9PEZI|nr:glycosyl hydrolase family 43 protein [Lineolata rhizophorae]